MTREPWKQFCDELATLKPSRRLMDLLYAAWSADEKMAQCDCISEAHYYATLASSEPPEIIGYVESVCVWRRGSDGYAVSGCAVPGWTWHADRLQAFRFCPYCGKPLTLAPDEPIRPPVEGQTP